MYTVMIVDDEKAIRNNLPHALDFRSLGFQVSAEAKNGRDALEQLEKTPADLVFLDVCMPVLDGVGFLRELSAWEEERMTVAETLARTPGMDPRQSGYYDGVEGYDPRAAYVDDRYIVTDTPPDVPPSRVPALKGKAARNATLNGYDYLHIARAHILDRDVSKR